MLQSFTTEAIAQLFWVEQKLKKKSKNKQANV